VPGEQKRTIRRLRLGQALKARRTELRWTLDQASAKLGRSKGNLSKIETGKSSLRPRDLYAFFNGYDISDPETQRYLLDLASRSLGPGYDTTYADIVRPTFADYLSLESTAKRIGIWGEVVPGLFQCESYAFKVVEASHAWPMPEQVDKFVQLRLDRQAVLTRSDDPPPTVWAVIGERALRQRVGSSETMCEQLDHLLKVGKLPNVSIQVMPFSAGPHLGDNGGFTTMDFVDEPSVVTVETLTSALYLEDPEVYREYEAAGEQLRKMALSPRGTASLIRDILKETT